MACPLVTSIQPIAIRSIRKASRPTAQGHTAMAVVQKTIANSVWNAILSKVQNYADFGFVTDEANKADGFLNGANVTTQFANLFEPAGQDWHTSTLRADGINVDP